MPGFSGSDEGDLGRSSVNCMALNFEEANMTGNPRAEMLRTASTWVASRLPGKPLSFIEIGCMFKEDEGLSTMILAEVIHSHPSGGKLYSCEYDGAHVEMCKSILRSRAPHLEEMVEFHVGHSLATLPRVLDAVSDVDFVSQDGGAHPEVCLQEFELLSTALSQAGVVVVDDAQALGPTKAYPLPRPFGKVTLILPYLLTIHYLQHRSELLNANAAPDGPDSTPDAWFLKAFEGRQLPLVEAARFSLFGDKHKMLVFGDSEFIKSARKQSEDSVVKPSLIGKLLRFWKKLGDDNCQEKHPLRP